MKPFFFGLFSRIVMSLPLPDISGYIVEYPLRINDQRKALQSLGGVDALDQVCDTRMYLCPHFLIFEGFRISMPH